MFDFERYRDRELLRRFRAGDRDAFSELYGEHSASVFRFVLAMTGDRVKTAEITQDVFVWLVRHPDGFDPERGELGAFLVGVARNVLKRRSSEEQRWVPLEPSMPAPAGTSGSHDVELLRQAIAALPLRYREVVVLCDLESRSYEEAAVIAECAVGTVRSRLHRARALLARKLTSTEKSSGRGCAV